MFLHLNWNFFINNGLFNYGSFLFCKAVKSVFLKFLTSFYIMIFLILSIKTMSVFCITIFFFNSDKLLRFVMLFFRLTFDINIYIRFLVWKKNRISIFLYWYRFFLILSLCIYYLVIMPVLYQYSEVILAKGFIFVFLYLCFLAIKKNSWLDLWLMSFQQKVCFISLHKWYLYLFRVHNKFQTRFLFLWIFCLLPLFYFFNYFIDCFYFIFVAFFQKVWAIPDFTFRSWHTCMEYFSFMKFTDLYMNFILLLNTEIVGFFNTFPLFCGFKNLNYLDALYFNLFFFFSNYFRVKSF